MTSLTAIYNTSTLFCYLFSVLLLPRSRSNSFQPLKLSAVALAGMGVFVVALGSRGKDKSDQERQDTPLGNIMAVVGAASYGFYEVGPTDLDQCFRYAKLSLSCVVPRPDPLFNPLPTRSFTKSISPSLSPPIFGHLLPRLQPYPLLSIQPFFSR